MNFVPRNTWEMEMSVWRCFMSEYKFKKEQAEQLNKEEAILNIMDGFELEDFTWQPGSR